MKHLANKLLIYLMCVTLLSQPWDVSSIAITCLSALSVACLGSYIENKRILFCLCAIYGIAALIMPSFALFLPVLLYDIPRLSVGSKIPMLCALAVTMGTFRNLTPATCAGLLICSAIAYALQYYSRLADDILMQFHHYRDDSTESSLSLKEKNQSLIERQDFEIHLATLTERNRIAREIHDNVGHMLTRSILQTGALRVINQDEALAKPIDELHETLNTAMTSIRNSVHDLHDEAINLEYALQDIVQSVSGIDVTLEYSIDSEIPRAVKYAFIAIVREAVSNVEKHSDADCLHIAVKEHPYLYQLLIKDNGTRISGIHLQSGQLLGGGIGLTNMQERIQALGGHINFSFEQGFRIFISVLKEITKKGNKDKQL